MAPSQMCGSLLLLNTDVCTVTTNMDNVFSEWPLVLQIATIISWR